MMEQTITTTRTMPWISCDAHVAAPTVVAVDLVGLAGRGSSA